MIKRYEKNPIITPEMIKPTNPEFKVIGAFNPGAVKYKDEIILLLRISETCVQTEGSVKVPMVDISSGKGRMETLEFTLSDPDLDYTDARSIFYKGKEYLSSISHLRIARSTDGYNFKIDDNPFISPVNEDEVYGVEDARMVFIDGYYYINYTAVSSNSWGTVLSKTKDFVGLEKLGMIFCPENKDVSIFPEKIKGKYCALHRPKNGGLGKSSIWYADSKDLIRWGNHKCVANPRDDKWEEMKIGGGAPSIKTKEGWLQIYHSAGQGQIYTLSAMLLDLEDPSRIIKRSTEPIMIPESSYEKKGFINDCIFTNGMVEKDGSIFIYYGASDQVTCVAETTVEDILATL